MRRCGAGLDLPAALQQALQCPLLGASVDAMRCAVAPRLHRRRRAQEPVRPSAAPILSGYLSGYSIVLCVRCRCGLKYKRANIVRFGMF